MWTWLWVSTSGALPLWRLYLGKLIQLVSRTTGFRQTVLKSILSLMHSPNSILPSQRVNSWQQRHSVNNGITMHLVHEHQSVLNWRGLLRISWFRELSAASILWSSSSVYSGSSAYPNWPYSSKSDSFDWLEPLL